MGAVIFVSALMREGLGEAVEVDTEVEEEAMGEVEEVMEVEIMDATVTEVMEIVIAMETGVMEEEIETKEGDAIEVTPGTEIAVALEVTHVVDVTAGGQGPAPGPNHGEEHLKTFPASVVK